MPSLGCHALQMDTWQVLTLPETGPITSYTACFSWGQLCLLESVLCFSRSQISLIGLWSYLWHVSSLPFQTARVI